jgi:archaellum component FlaC
MESGNIIHELNNILSNLEQIKNSIEEGMPKEKSDSIVENLRETIEEYQKLEEDIKNDV